MVKQWGKKGWGKAESQRVSEIVSSGTDIHTGVIQECQETQTIGKSPQADGDLSRV